MNYTRRDMLKASLSSMAYYSTAATTPNWIIQAANAMAQQNNAADDRILVIVQFGGGMDGLNVVIPRTDDVYYDDQTRPTIRVPKGLDINLDGLNGLHPVMVNLAEWYQQGCFGVVNNVGYENPNQSHFTSTDIYEYGQNPLQYPLLKGWAARYYDSQCNGCEPNPMDMLVGGKTSVPDSLSGADFYQPPAINNPADYSLRANEDEEARLRAIYDINQVQTNNPQQAFLQRSANLVHASISDIATAAALPSSGLYGNDTFSKGMRLISQVIRAGFSTKIFYASHGGFDTHANQASIEAPLQAGTLPRLLDRFDQTMHAFLTEMKDSGNLDRVMVMTFSEFGRRVRENGSNGTDHGAANCLFVMGGGINAGVYGGQPDLIDTDHGNLRYKVDFRSVYAQMIEGWFGSSAVPVFGQSVYDNTIRNDLSQIPLIKAPAAGVAAGVN
ncbi:MAG: DUF1501 domain-containing protein [bacterium]|nr:DUF1501 domain-containing protein [bacterium]